MTPQANLVRLKAAYKAWNDSKGMSQSTWLDLMAHDVTIRSMTGPEPGLAFAARRYSKKEGVAYLAAITQDWTMVHWTPQTFVVDGDKIAVFSTCAWNNKKTGKTAEPLTAQLWEFEKGLITSYTEIFDSARVVAAATP